MNPLTPRPISKPLISKQQSNPLEALLTQRALRWIALWTALGTMLWAPLWAAETAPTDPALTTPADSGSDPRILPDLEQERLQALANSQLPGTETLWLETPHESFLGLFKPANSPAASGAVLLLHHDRTSADWPGSITTLRQGLPNQGWHTLSIALPDAPEYIPPRTEDIVLARLDNPNSASSAAVSAPAAPVDTPDKLQAHFEQISARIEAGLNYLSQLQPDKILILGEGTGGYWALRYSVGLGESSTLFPVLIDTLAPTEPTQPDLVELISTLQRPTLDLYHGNGMEQQPIELLALQRRNAAKRQGSGLLTSIRIAPRTGHWHQPDKRLLGVMRGTLPRILTAPGSKARAQPQQSPLGMK